MLPRRAYTTTFTMKDHDLPRRSPKLNLLEVVVLTNAGSAESENTDLQG